MKLSGKLAATCLTVLPFAAPYSANAQPPQPPAPVVKAAMEKLAWLEGEWEGTGWRDGRGGRETFKAAEKVHAELDGILLIFHGRGWSVGADGQEKEGHKAFAVLSFDSFAQTYRFDAFVKEGYQTRGEPVVGENEYHWSVPAGAGAEMRYHVRLTEDGEWFETGERCAGEICKQFFEMRLAKVSD